MTKLSKRQKALAEIDREKFYGVDEALSLVKKNATAKMKDLNANDLVAATKIIEGSARAMGLDVVEG